LLASRARLAGWAAARCGHLVDWAGHTLVGAVPGVATSTPGAVVAGVGWLAANCRRGGGVGMSGCRRRGVGMSQLLAGGGGGISGCGCNPWHYDATHKGTCGGGTCCKWGQASFATISSTAALRQPQRSEGAAAALHSPHWLCTLLARVPSAHCLQVLPLPAAATQLGSQRWQLPVALPWPSAQSAQARPDLSALQPSAGGREGGVGRQETHVRTRNRAVYMVGLWRCRDIGRCLADQAAPIGRIPPPAGAINDGPLPGSGATAPPEGP